MIDFYLSVFSQTKRKTLLDLYRGGMTAVALDDATAVTVCMQLEGLKVPNSTDIHITYHRPVSLGEALIEVKVLKLGKQIVSVEGKLYTSRKKLAATMLHTAVLLEIPL
jgi:acyl-CoA thioesterase